MKMFLRRFLLRCCKWFASDIRDVHTHRVIGRAFLFCWRGKIYVIGLDSVVIPIFYPQRRLTYWKQEIGFTVHPEVDFLNETNS